MEEEARTAGARYVFADSSARLDATPGGHGVHGIFNTECDDHIGWPAWPDVVEHEDWAGSEGEHAWCEHAQTWTHGCSAFPWWDPVPCSAQRGMQP